MVDGSKREWEERTLGPVKARFGERRERFESDSGLEIDTVYTPEDVGEAGSDDRLGLPGEYPFTRGVQPNTYRGRLWTMRQYAGLTSPAESNRRYRYLLEQGQTGLSVAFDLPTQMGYDSDHPLAVGEVGRAGVPISSLADMERLFDGIPLDGVSTSMTINATASILLALYVVAAKKQGVKPASLEGTLQNDILKEYIARGTYIYPPKPSMRLVTDVFGYSSREAPRWNTISISGYHMREAGATAVQELAFTFANAIAYVQAAVDSGLDVDDFGGQAFLLLRGPEQPAGGSGEVPRGPQDVGEDHAREVRRGETPVVDAEVPHPDRRRVPHCSTAREQRRQDDSAGPGGSARRHTVAARKLEGRGACAAD